MVNEQVRWMLTYMERVDPAVIARVTNTSEQECWEFLSDLDIAMNEYQKEREEYLPILQQQLEEWVASIPEANEVRRQVLLEKLKLAKKNPERYDVPKLLREYRTLTKKGSDITEDQIERAREYPLEQLIEHRRYMAKCPFHPDKTASLYIKNNFYHCFGCQANGDTIDFMMKKDNLSFPEAVRYLSGT